jgi:hypothetical protein
MRDENMPPRYDVSIYDGNMWVWVGTYKDKQEALERARDHADSYSVVVQDHTGRIIWEQHR